MAAKTNKQIGVYNAYILNNYKLTNYMLLSISYGSVFDSEAMELINVIPG